MAATESLSTKTQTDPPTISDLLGISSKLFLKISEFKTREFGKDEGWCGN